MSDEDGGTGTHRANLDIARDEADETFKSIANLDSIGDTAIVGITFLLAALGTWTTFIFPELDGHPTVRLAFVLLVAISVLATIASVYYLVNSLAPRQFYGEGVGERFLDHQWIPWLNDDPVELERFSRTDIDSPADLEAAVEGWIDRYDADTRIDSQEAFVYSRLLNYKLVARQKARNAAYGMAFLRIAIVVLGVLVITGLATMAM
jgi:hypothetical protein